MLEVGQFIKIDGIEYGILDNFKHNEIDYWFLSVLEDGNLDYRFYTVNSSSEEEGYDLELVLDDNLNNILMEIEEDRIKNKDSK